MRLELAAVAAALLWFGFLLAERPLLARARRRLRIVVHVNGTRGKSETTRLIAAALRAAGIRTVAKTTGTEPRMILPDGSERRLRRLGAPDVREQKRLLLRAARMGAEALVAECMAVSPEAQYASTTFLGPTILALTNFRPDHASELGNPEEALAVFARGIPPGGIVATADAAVAHGVEAAARAAGARLVVAKPTKEVIGVRGDNASLALAVAMECGVERERALAGMRDCAPDPGAFALRRFARPAGGMVTFVDALSANDVVSTELLYGEAEELLGAEFDGAGRFLLLSSREDRPERTLAFAEWAALHAERWDRVFLVGPVPLSARRRLAKAFVGSSVCRVPRRLALKSGGQRLLGTLADQAGAEALLFCVGNWKGLGGALSDLTERISGHAKSAAAFGGEGRRR